MRPVSDLALAAAFSSALALSLAAAATAGPAQVAPAAVSFSFGKFKMTALRDADNVVANDNSVFGIGKTPADVSAVLKAAGAPTDKVVLGVDALLVQGYGRVMLFDTGLGPKVKGQLVASLALAGVTPDDVTDVFITHSHFDHVGGLADAEGKPIFPKASIHLSTAEWAFMQTQASDADVVKAITPRVKPFEDDQTLAPGLKTLALHGHTPGHTGYEISSGPLKLIDIGDSAHSAVISLAKPNWDVGYDQDKVAGKAERKAILAKVAASHEWVFAPHFPFPGVGHVVAKGDGFVWVPGLPK
jgi:glyoxylase-like metal-dependent hydrolase (beta-lactamase superfamily II)